MNYLKMNAKAFTSGLRLPDSDRVIICKNLDVSPLSLKFGGRAP